MSPIDGDTLKEQAVFFAKKLGFNDADIDSSWINRFKKRHGILQVKKCGEEAGVNEEVLETWRNGKLREILSTYSPSETYLTLMRRGYSGRCYLNKLLGLVAPRIMVLNTLKPDSLL